MRTEKTIEERRTTASGARVKSYVNRSIEWIFIFFVSASIVGLVLTFTYPQLRDNPTQSIAPIVVLGFLVFITWMIVHYGFNMEWRFTFPGPHILMIQRVFFLETIKISLLYFLYCMAKRHDQERVALGITVSITIFWMGMVVLYGSPNFNRGEALRMIGPAFIVPLGDELFKALDGYHRKTGKQGALGKIEKQQEEEAGYKHHITYSVLYSAPVLISLFSYYIPQLNLGLRRRERGYDIERAAAPTTMIEEPTTPEGAAAPMVEEPTTPEGAAAPSAQVTGNDFVDDYDESVTTMILLLVEAVQQNMIAAKDQLIADLQRKFSQLESEFKSKTTTPPTHAQSKCKTETPPAKIHVQSESKTKTPPAENHVIGDGETDEQRQKTSLVYFPASSDTEEPTRVKDDYAMAAMNALQKMQLDLNTETKSKTETPPTENRVSSNGETDEQRQKTSLVYFPASSDTEEPTRVKDDYAMAAMNALQKMQLDLNTETKSKTETPPTENRVSSNGETDEQRQRTSLVYFPASPDEEESTGDNDDYAMAARKKNLALQSLVYFPASLVKEEPTEALPGGESGNIGTSLNGENEEKITGLEGGNKMDSNTKEEEFSTAVKQTASGNQKKEEQIVLGEQSPGRTKKLNPGKDPTSKRNEMISSISPKGETNKNKRQLNQLLKSNPGGHASSEFYWDAGGTPRGSPRISKSKSLETLEKEPAKKRRGKSSSSKEGNKKNNDNEETEASDGAKIATAAAKVAEGTQARSDVEMKKAEDGHEMNKEVTNGEVLPGGESLDIILAGSKDENEENITKKSLKTKYSETGIEMVSNTKEDEMNTAEKQTEAENMEKEKIVLGELQAPPGWKKKLIPKKGRHTCKKIKIKRQLNQFLKSNPEGPASSEFYWGAGILENESPKKRGRKSSSNRSSVSKFRDGRISAGNWVHKDFVSRDGQMKLGTHVYFASIDQRSESAGGESACTVLVVVIANWFQTNHDSMPTDSQFDSLIREGSLEWRNLCAEETIKKLFPDKHLDLQTVLQANIRPISSSEKSFVGFFFPDGMNEGDLNFLNEVVPFDRIWDEISSCAEKNCVSGGGPQVYIVSWNDHFFILKVEAEAYYLMDTLGERLYEGCDQAYVLKFDKDTTIHNLHEEVVKKTETVDQLIMAEAEKETDTVPQLKLKEDLIANVESGKKEDILCTRKESGKQVDIVCTGKESCKEYIKSFLAAISLTELQIHIKEGRPVELKNHLRCLQIEFHYVEFLLPNI